MKRKKLLFIILAVIVLLVLVMVMLPKPKELSIQTGSLDNGHYTDGEYTGRCENGLVAVSVSVTVADGRVENIEILEHRNGLGSAAEGITEAVFEEQTLQVDAISGATYSSNTILKAIENALNGQ